MTRGIRLIVLASIVALSACGSNPAPGPASGPGSPAVPAVPTGPACHQSRPDAQSVAVPGTGGQALTGYTVGTGAVGVVLGNQANSTACDWLSYARDLAQRGYRVLAFDFNGENLSAESDGSET